MYRNLLTLTGAVVALTALTTAIVGLSLQACAPDRDQYEAQPQDTTITLPTEDPCNPDFTETGRWCWSPICGEWAFTDCFAEHFEVSWSQGNATLTLRTGLPVCPDHLEIHDSECEWLDDSFDFHIAPTTTQTGTFWEIIIELEPEFAECVAAYATWCIEIEIRTICPQ